MTDREKLKMIYKAETGMGVSEWSFEVFRSKGQWILEIDDESKVNFFGGRSEFDVPDLDYIEWLEQKVLENEKS